MFYAELTSDDFIGAVEALLPPGPCFPRDPDSWQTRFYSAIALFFWQLHQDIIRFFDQETDPNRTQDMLPDWQAAFGIIARGTEDEQRAQLAAVIADPGGFTAAHYVALAARIGIAITVVATGAFTWTVHAPLALSADDRAALETEIAKYNRATCVVTFTYDL
jgi:uncharacterized protein YmfQ (DUF2313 family)